MQNSKRAGILDCHLIISVRVNQRINLKLMRRLNSITVSQLRGLVETNRLEHRSVIRGVRFGTGELENMNVERTRYGMGSGIGDREGADVGGEKRRVWLLASVVTSVANLADSRFGRVVSDFNTGQPRSRICREMPGGKSRWAWRYKRGKTE